MKNFRAAESSVLFIAYYFPPIASIGVWRNYYLAKESKQFFKRVFVSTQSANQKNKSTEDEFTIIQNRTFDYRRLFRKDNTESIGFSEESKQGTFVRLGIKLINSFPFNVLLGEGGLTYVLESVKKSNRLIKSGNIKAIYSSYRPMSDHIIAFILKKRNPHLIWTADFRDLPFDPLYKNYFWFSFQKYILTKILKNADVVCCFNKGIQSGLNVFTDKDVKILENGFFGEKSITSDVQLANQFTIQYTGSLFLEERDPTPLFKAVRKLCDENNIDEKQFKLCYVGKDHQRWKHYIDKFKLTSVSEIAEIIPVEEAKKLQVRAHINLLLTSAHAEYKGIFTGKFFEYVIAERPMICIIKGEKDLELENIFKKYNLGLIGYNDANFQEKLDAFLISQYTIWQKTGTLLWCQNRAIYDDFNWNKTIQKWLKILENG